MTQRGEDPKARFGNAKPGTKSIPPSALYYLGQVMQTGADKYGPMNWRNTEVVASTYREAIGRHLDTWWDGEDLTRDTKVKNLAAVMASCAILLDAELHGTLVDDRPPPGKLGDLIESLTKPTEETNVVDMASLVTHGLSVSRIAPADLFKPVETVSAPEMEEAYWNFMRATEPPGWSR